MKTTLEIPDPLLRRAKSAAAERGVSLRQLISKALTEKLSTAAPDKPWLAAFGKLRSLRKETARLDEIVAHEFEILEYEDLG